MSSRVEIPAGAVCVKTDSAVYPIPHQWAGQTLKMAAYTGYASDGYKSNYTPRPCAWLEMHLPDERKPRRWRMGGKNFAKWEETYRSWVAGFSEAFPGAVATFPT